MSSITISFVKKSLFLPVLDLKTSVCNYFIFYFFLSKGNKLINKTIVTLYRVLFVINCVTFKRIYTAWIYVNKLISNKMLSILSSLLKNKKKFEKNQFLEYSTKYTRRIIERSNSERNNFKKPKARNNSIKRKQIRYFQWDTSESNSIEQP